MSQKYSDKSKLEEMVKLRDSYLVEFEETGSRAAEIRYKFLDRKIYGALYRGALKDYNALFELTNAFSMNQKD